MKRQGYVGCPQSGDEGLEQTHPTAPGEGSQLAWRGAGGVGAVPGAVDPQELSRAYWWSTRVVLCPQTETDALAAFTMSPLW